MGNSSDNSERSPQADKLLCRAEELREESRYLQSLRLFKQALRRYARREDLDGIYHCLVASGDLYRMTGRFELAVGSYIEAIEAARASRSAVSVADAKVGLGLALRAQGNWRDAIKLIRQSEKVFRKRDDMHGLAFSLWAEAGALRIKGDIAGALETFRESHKLFRLMEDDHGVGYCLCGLGGASRMAGRFKSSLGYYLTANGLFSSLRDRFGRAYSFCGIGNAYRMMGDYENALANFGKATALYKKLGDTVSYAYTLWGIGTAWKMMGVHRKAKDHFTKAMRFFRKTRDPRGIIYCDLGFGEISLLEGKRAGAKRYLLKAFDGAAANGFALELCHARTLLSFLEATVSAERTGANWSQGRPGAKCYLRLGSKLRFRTLPLNIP